MAFAEDTAAFLDVDDFAVNATLGGDPVQVIFDAPGAEVFDGAVATTEPSALIEASAEPEVGQALVLSSGNLPAQLVQHAGTYTVRSVMPESPDGAFVRLFLVKA